MPQPNAVTTFRKIGLTLRELRDKRGLTQKQLSEKTGIAEEQISRYENSAVEPTLLTLWNIADALKVSLDELTGRKKRKG